MYRLMNDPEYFEQWRFKDTIDNYNMILEELEKHYDQTPVTNRYTRSRILSTMKRAQRDLEKIQADYEQFKRYKERTRISR